LFGDYAYIANSNDGMRIYDVSDPAHPINVGHAPQVAMATASGIAVSGVERHRSWWLGKTKIGARYAYLANYNDGIRIYDVSNPANPKRIGRVNDGGTALSATVSGKYLFLANDSDGLRIYDVSNPSWLTNVAHIKDTGYPQAVAVAGKYAYVADNFYGFSIFDVSDPTHPTGIGHIKDGPRLDGSGHGIAVGSKYACLANFRDGVRVYDVSDPTDPVNISCTATNFGGFAMKVAVSRGFAFVANANDGLRIYKIWDEASAPSATRFLPFLVIILGLLGGATMYWRSKVASAKHQADSSP
jgi:hypothetical protein